MPHKRVDLKITAPDPKHDREEMFELISKVFSGHKNYYEWQSFLRESYIDPSKYDWSVSRIGRVGEQMVTHYGVWEYQMRIGSAKVRAGGVGAVATDGQWRKRGLLAQTARESIEAMRREGYHFTLLFGLRNFYHQFGYVRAWNEPTYSVWYGDLPHEKPTPAARAFNPVRRDDVEKLYNREHRGLTGTAIRPTYTNINNVYDCKGMLWRGAKNKLAGYVYYHMRFKKLEILESAGDVEQTLRVVAMLMRKHRVDEVLFPGLPWDHKLAKRLRAMDCRLEKNFNKCGGPMIRTVNLRGALNAMSSELERRLKDSPIRDWSGKLRIRDPRETVTINAKKGKLTLAADNKGRADVNLSGGEEIAQLLIGSEAPEEIIERSGIKLTGKDGQYLSVVLFPEQHPTIRIADRY